MAIVRRDRGIDPVTLEDNISNAPEQAERRIQYERPLASSHIAQLKMRSIGILHLTKEELEYLVTAGNAILRHTQELKENESNGDGD